MSGYEWMDQAACSGADPDLFFPERGDPTAEAKAVCRACPVRQQCLDHALANREKFGVWGGMSERERRRLRRGRPIAKPCTICGHTFDSGPIGQRTTCSRACWEENRRRSQDRYRTKQAG